MASVGDVHCFMVSLLKMCVLINSKPTPGGPWFCVSLSSLALLTKNVRFRLNVHVS